MTTQLQRTFEIELLEDDIHAGVEKKLLATAETARMNGFRRGHVPLSFIRKKYGDDFLTEILRELLGKQLDAEILSRKEAVAGGIHVQGLWNAWDRPIRYRYLIQFEVFPEFELQGLDKLTVNAPTPATIDDAQIDTFIEIMRRERSTWELVDRPAQLGDSVIINFDGRLDGQPFPGGHGYGVKIDLGAGGMLPAFESALIGAVAGQALHFPVSFPLDYQTAILVGKTAEFDVTILKVRAIQLLPLDEDFARRCGIAGGMDELRDALRKNLEKQHLEQDRRDMANHVLAQFRAANDIPLPDVLIAQHIQSIQAEVAHQRGRDITEIDIDDDIVAAARRRTQMGILVRHLVLREEMKADQTRCTAKLAAMIMSDDDPTAAAMRYHQNPAIMQQIESEVLQEQVIEWLITRAESNVMADSAF